MFYEKYEVRLYIFRWSICEMRSVKFCVKCELKFWKNSLQIGDAINFWHYARNFSYTLDKSKESISYRHDREPCMSRSVLLKPALEKWGPLLILPPSQEEAALSARPICTIPSWFEKHISWHTGLSVMTIRYAWSKDGQYGNCAKPTNCSGIIGMVQRNEVDFAIGLRQI